MATTALPATYPMPGTYSVDYMNLYFGCATPGATVYYTLDGSEPTTNSATFRGLLDGSVPVLSFMERPEGGVKEVTVKCFAQAPGAQPSRVATYRYEFHVQEKDEYAVELLREGTAGAPALFRLTDWCRANMFLVVGSERAMLVDGGVSHSDAILKVVDELAGGLPVDLFVTHGHLDHNGAVWPFLASGHTAYVPSADLETFLAGGGEAAPAGTTDVADGDRYDLGNTTLVAYFLPGHTPGGFVLLDETTGDLFASDELVNNDPWGPNSLLLSLYDDPESSAEAYYERFRGVMTKLDGRAERIWTGHNTFPLDGPAYLGRIDAMFADAMERGEEALMPSIRPSTEGNSMLGFGNYKTDTNNLAVCIKYLTREDARAHRHIPDLPVC